MLKAQGLKASDFLTERERNDLALALVAEADASGRDINEAASQEHIDLALQWATYAVWRYHLLREVLRAGKGLIVADGKVAVTPELAQKVLSEAMMDGIAPSART